MSLSLPDAHHRFRCTRCGNLTRFDVVRQLTVKEFWHLDMAGDVSIDATETTQETVMAIACRWCGATHDEIERVLRPSSGGPDSEPESASSST